MPKKTKPGKPHKDFPLFAHGNGQWAKKVRGQLHYFGSWNDPGAALGEWIRQKDDLLAGRSPRRAGEELTLLHAFNQFLDAKKSMVDLGEMSQRSWDEYCAVLTMVAAELGKNRPVAGLHPVDFTRLRAAMAMGKQRQQLAPGVFGRRIQLVRCAFNWMYEADLIERGVKFGPDFKMPPKAVRRKYRLSKPKRLFSPVDVRRLIVGSQSHDRYQLRAMILLGLNCGFGNTDCSVLRMSEVDLVRGIVDNSRHKTGIERRAPLWPETVDALKVVVDRRPEAKSPGDADLVFLTEGGQPWVRYVTSEAGRAKNLDYISTSFQKLAQSVGIDRNGVGFYALRHTFETVAGGTGRQPEIDRIMGHEANDMAVIYREWERSGEHDARLRIVTDFVREWYLSGISEELKREADAKAAKREAYLQNERERNRRRARKARARTADFPDSAVA